MKIKPIIAGAQQHVESGLQSTGLTSSGNLGDFIGNVVNALTFIVGAVSVIMIIIGGLRFVLSGGNATTAKAARETVLYAVVGLVVAILSYALADFVISRF